MSQQKMRSPLGLDFIHTTETSEIIATIAHEMRNPLTTVLMGLTHCQKLSLPSHDRLRIELALEEG
jgi:signal transduction histidine kinase